MSQHFSAIGFDLSDSSQLLDFARACVGKSEAYQSARRDFTGAAFRWNAGRGIEVWTAVREVESAVGEEDYEIVSCLPAWRCKETLALRAWRIERRREDRFELNMAARLEDGRELSFALVNLWQNPDLPARGADGVVHLCGLVLEAECSRPEDAPRLIDGLSVEDSLKTLESALIPLDRDNHYRVAGKIIEADETANIHTGKRLCRVLVELDGLRLPLIFARDLSQTKPEAGLRFDGLIWLSGLLP